MMFGKDEIITPAVVFDMEKIASSLKVLEALRRESGCLILYSLKALAFGEVVNRIGKKIDGFSTSSLFEARMARECVNDVGTVHFTTPGLRADEVEAISETCDYITFNSLTQWYRFSARMGDRMRCGIRINPQLSFVDDERYDACRKHSKLGAPLDQMVEVLSKKENQLKGVSGLHFHTNCDSKSFTPLLETVRHVESHLTDLLWQIEWVNMGGGYELNGSSDIDALCEAVDLLRSKYKLEVFIEPGAAVVRDAGYLIASVLDVFGSDGKEIAVLDATVNHMPEVFEYQFEPDVAGHIENGRYKYVLAGCTCLAGDLFGEYAFDEPLEIGSRILFTDMGAYTLVKSHMFNGVNLPAIYTLTDSGKVVLRKQFSYQDFASRCGVTSHASI